MNTVAQLFMVVGGALAGYVVIGFSAALGKLIVGAILRFQFDEFIFFMIRVGRKADGISVGLCDPQPYISCSMLDTKYTKFRNLIYGAFSMAVAIFSTETMCFQLYGTKIIPSNPLTIAMSVVMLVYTLLLFFFLCVTQKKKAGNDPDAIIRREYERCFAAIKTGAAPAEVKIQQVDGTGKLTDRSIYRKYLLTSYYYFLDLGDYANVKAVMDKLENYVPEKWSKADFAMLCEFVFYHIIIAPNEGKARYYAKTFMEKLDGTEEVNARRVFAYWLFFIEKDKGAALQVAVEAMKMVKFYRLIGCRAMETRLLEALINRIGNTP